MKMGNQGVFFLKIVPFSKCLPNVLNSKHAYLCAYGSKFVCVDCTKFVCVDYTNGNTTDRHAKTFPPLCI